MNVSIWRSLALLIAGALIGIFGSLLIKRFEEICYNNIYIWIIFIVLIGGLFFYGTGFLSILWHLVNIKIIRRCFPKIGVLNDIGWLFSNKNTAEVEKGLSKGVIPPKIDRSFKKKDITLSENTFVEQKEEDEWEITDGKNSYIIKKEDIILNIYEKKELSTAPILPEEWKKLIEDSAKKERIKKIRVKLIKIKKTFDSYATIINPYGGIYPESDLENFVTMDKILVVFHHQLKFTSN
jgi:hypothetical protein